VVGIEKVVAEPFGYGVAFLGRLGQLQLAYVLGLVPMAIGLYGGNKVHMDLTSGGMLRVVGTLLVLSGAMLFLKVAA
jgi:uncharacterized membrane protein YccC